MVGKFFTALFAKITAVLEWFVQLVIAVFVAVWDLIKDAFSWLFEEMLSVSASAIKDIDTSGIDGLTSYGGLPGEVMNILGLLGVGQAIAIITAAIGIRFMLQLIPFVRLGS